MIAADVIVVGAGPAGIAAATAAAGQGLSAIVLDDNPQAGGQIWRSGVAVARTQERDRRKGTALRKLAVAGVEVLARHTVFDADPAAHTLHALREDEHGQHALTLVYRHLVIATGARERFLPFPGWTLPGVFGAGGLQALVQGGYPVAGKRIVVAGTGPLLLAVASHLHRQGARIMAIVEQASAVKIIRFACSLWRQPAKLLQAARYRTGVARTRMHWGCWPTAALHDAQGHLHTVSLTDGRRTWEEPCDLLACGFHLVPNNGLPLLLGCAMNGSFVVIDEQQRTSVPDVFCAGEPAGIAGLDAALTQGEIAGLACAGILAPRLARRAAKERRFAFRLEKTFALRPELRSLAAPETIVCRCEDVPLARLQPYTGWTEAKLQTRCGMGSCQGRICGPAVEAVLGWTPVSVRSPLYPVPFAALCPAPASNQLP